MVNYVFVTFPCGIPRQVWCLIISALDLCSLFLLILKLVTFIKLDKVVKINSTFCFDYHKCERPRMENTLTPKYVPIRDPIVVFTYHYDMKIVSFTS